MATEVAHLKAILDADSSKFTSALGAADTRMKKTAKVAGVAGLLIAGALVLGLKKSVEAAIDFESSFAGVRKVVEGTEPQLQALADGIRDMAKEIPATTTELNAIAASAGQLGIKREAILGFTRVIADLGETTNLVGEEGAASLARFANIVQMKQKNFDRLGSTIVALGNAGASTEKEIVDMGLRIAGAGKIVGLTAPEILAMANALSSVGIEAESGGSAISRVMVDIEKAVRKGGEKLAMFADVAGESSAKFKKHWEEDAADALVTFIEGLGKLDKQGGNVFKTLDDLDLGTLRVRDALLRASGAGDLLRDSLKVGTDAWKDNIALQAEAKKRYETTAAKIQIVKNNLNDVAITIGEAVLPFLKRFLDRLQEWIELAQEHPEAIKIFIGALGLLAAALLTAAAAQLLLNLEVLANPYVAAVVAIMIFVGAAILLAQKFDFVRRHWQIMLITFGLAPVIVATIVKAIVRNFDKIKPVLTTIKNVAQAVFNAIAGYIRSLISPILTVIGYVQDLIGWISRIHLPFGIGSGSGSSFYSGGGAGPRGGPPSGATGGYVARSGLAIIHKGEHLVPSAVNRGGGGGRPGRFVVLADHETVAYLRNAVASWERTNGRQAFG